MLMNETLIAKKINKCDTELDVSVKKTEGKKMESLRGGYYFRVVREGFNRREHLHRDLNEMKK